MDPSFDQYLRDRGGGLLRFAYVLCGNYHLAEDLVQEVLARSYRSWHRIESGNPDAYFRKAVVRAHISWWRRFSNREMPAEIIAEPQVEDYARRHALHDELWRLLAKLSRRQRAVLVLRYFEDLDDETVARIVGCSAATAQVHAHRGLSTLRSRLSTPAEEALR